ncbi:hypothetical protein [Burkholderia sp. LMU1-1-1.1]|uniref:hypothetical protein n=1 Tax=Burkholderia sp. LMU1-1-1.1 TaxID=3135266 RepID=UPI00342066F9
MAVCHPLSPGGETHVLLDANVLLPPRLSDVLFDLCLEGLFWARWSAEIEAEFLRNWPRVAFGARAAKSGQQADAEAIKAGKRLLSYKRAVRGHEIIGYQASSVLARVPAAVNVADRHVAAAALVLRDLVLQDNAHNRVIIVSNNLKHLAVADMRRLDVLVVAPGKFIDSLTQASSVRVGSALERCVNSLKNPRYTRARLLDALQVHGALATARHFSSVWRLEL